MDITSSMSRNGHWVNLLLLLYWICKLPCAAVVIIPSGHMTKKQWHNNKQWQQQCYCICCSSVHFVSPVLTTAVLCMKQYPILLMQCTLKATNNETCWVFFCENKTNYAFSSPDTKQNLTALTVFSVRLLLIMVNSTGGITVLSILRGQGQIQ